MNRPTRNHEQGSLVTAHASLDALLERVAERAGEVGAERALERAAEDGAESDVTDTAGIAQYLGVSTSTVRKERDRGMPHFKVAEAYRYHKPSVLDWYRGGDR